MVFNPTNDFFEGLRRFLIPKLGALVSVWNDATGDDHYVSHPTWKNQFVGRVDMGEEDFEEVLETMGFRRNPLAALKHRIDTDEQEEGSFRKLGTDFPEEDDNFQLHVIIYDGKLPNNADTGETYIYAHWEYRWDTNPQKHYDGVDYQPEKGVRMMRDLLTRHGVSYDDKRPDDGE